MGQPSELVIAKESDARDIAESDSPSRTRVGVMIQGLDPVKLGALWALLEGTPGSRIDYRVAQFKELHAASSDGPWVYGLPRQLRDLLSDLAGQAVDELEPVVRAWAAAPELEDWSEPDVMGVVRDLADMAEAAKVADNDLLLWMSL
jgi:hypothetical protein